MLVKSSKEHPRIPRACEAERSVFGLLLLVYDSLDRLGIVVRAFEDLLKTTSSLYVVPSPPFERDIKSERPSLGGLL